MSNPKRKVTDLLPTEAILISSDADLKVLDEFEKAGITWIDGALATSFNPLSFSGEENVIIHIELERIVWAYTEGSGLTIYPATDFIPTESDEVDKFETTDFKLGVFIRSKVDWYESNHDYQVATDTIRCWLDEFLQQEETRNTPNQ